MKNTPLIKHLIYYALLAFTCVFCLELLILTLPQSNWHDFDVFYNSARAALDGKSIYIISGQYDLPFWYFPWAAWFYFPLAIFPRAFALTLYQIISIISGILATNSLLHSYNSNFKFQDKLLIFVLLIPLSLELISVGQMDYILLGLTVITMYAIEKKKDILAGALFPLLWIKPHLFIVFTLFAFWRAGKRTVLISLILSTVMLLIETAISPGWQFEMLKLLQSGTHRINDGLRTTTLPSLLGSPENWVGTANIPFTALLILLAILITWKFRSLPTIPLLSLALVASLFCAPRAFAYDNPLLIPAMIWLTAKEFNKTFWLWIAAAIICFLTGYTSNGYLLTLLIFALSILKAYKTVSVHPNVLDTQPN